MHYEVTYEARKVGAIGTFSPRTVRVIGDSPARARDAAFAQIHREGYETRAPISMVEVPSPCCCGAWEVYPGTYTDAPEDWCPVHGPGADPQPKRRIEWPSLTKSANH